MWTRTLLLASLLAWCSIAVSTDGGSASRDAQLFEAYEQARALEFEQRSELTEVRFRELFAKELAATSMADIGDAELHEFFEAAALSRGGLPNDAYDALPGRIHAELERREIATAEESKRMFRLAVQWRRFDEARALAARHPDLGVDALPADATTIPVSSHPAVLDYAAEPTAISVRPITVDQGARVVVLSHPLCGPSERAKQAIEADPLLSKSFVAQSIWIAPPGGQLLAEVFAEKNDAHPKLPIRPMTHRADWPMVDEYRTPVFYFLQDGVVQAKVVGWPPEGNRDAVIAGLKKIGLAD